MTKKILFKIVMAIVGLWFIGTLAAVCGWTYLDHWLKTPLTISEQGYSYELKSGQTLSHLAHDLAVAGVLKHPRLLRAYARFTETTKVHAGEYFLAQGLTPEGLLEKLNKGDVVLYQVTFVEGWTVKQALDVLARAAEINHQLLGKTPEQQVALLNLPVSHLEGWIFPDTYNFSRNTSDIEILQNAYRKMQSVLSDAWEKRATDLPYKTPYEALIMASIVERETGHHSERDEIAGVFVRRLQQGMKLQTDPTVIYGMGDAYQGRITRKDLEQATAYNTYVISGLPPTPISLPSAASINAALNPAAGNALYFVAKGDGTSEFSATLDAHNAAVRRYQLQRRADYRAAPPPPVTVSSSSNSSSSSSSLASGAVSAAD